MRSFSAAPRLFRKICGIHYIDYQIELPMNRINLAAVLSALLLIGCASAPASKQSTQSSNGACAITVIQGGEVLQSIQSGRIQSYDLKAAPFRFEVASAQCKPSIGVFTSQQDFQYVAESSIVATTNGFSMAGSDDTKDVLFFRSENPRLVDGYEDIFDSHKNVYEALCAEFGKCPQKIRAYRTYWNFFGDREGVAEKTADFKRISVTKPVAGYRGIVSLVVYTTVKDVAGGYISVMETHPIVLKFK